MIDDLDRSLERLLRTRVPLPADQFDVSFEAPTTDWMKRLSAGRRTVNLYLYDVRENHGLRDTEWREERRPDGTFVRKRPKVRMDLFYAVTAWSSATPPDPFDEHRLLGQLLRTLLRYPTLPAEVMQGALAGQAPPLPSLVAQPDNARNPWELWSAIGNRVRPALHLVVTMGVEPAAEPEPPVVTAPVVSRRMGVGGELRPVVRVRVRPPLPEPLPAGTQLRIGRVAAAAAARLGAPVFNDPGVITVAEAMTLAANSWYMLDGGAESDFFRLPTAPGAGEMMLRMAPPLRWAHPAGREVKGMTLTPALTRLAAASAFGAMEIALESGDGVGDGEWLLLEDGDRSELVLTAAHAAGAAAVPSERPLRWPHPAGTLVRRATPGAVETTLRDPANAGTATLTLDSRAALDDGTLAEGTPVLLDAGAAAEVLAIGPIPASPSVEVPAVPPPAGNHAADAALRVISEQGVAGRLIAEAAQGAAEIFVEGEEAAAIVAGAPVRAAGSAWMRVEAATNEVMPVAGETMYRLEGRVVSDAPGAPPVEGARVVIQELNRAMSTAADGRYVFSNLPPGSYTLAVSAAGFGDITRVVAVPAAGVDEYTLVVGTG
ncbi:MAG TPA: Pvc16 family protein [Longimicrobium sp.]